MLKEGDVVSVASKKILDKEQEFFTVVFEHEDKKYDGEVVSVSSTGLYKIKVKGLYEYG